jgi:hypothetical protein
MPLSVAHAEEIIREAVSRLPKGDQVLATQVQQMRLESLDPDGSYRLIPTQGIRHGSVRGVFVDGESVDEDGAPIYLLLHVTDGLLSELQVYRGDLQRVVANIDPGRIQYFA